MRQPPACWSDWTKVAFDLLQVCAYKASAVFFSSPQQQPHTSWSLGSRLAMMMNVFLLFFSLFLHFELLLRISNC